MTYAARLLVVGVVCAAAAAIAGCSSSSSGDWARFDVLQKAAPRAPQRLRDVPIRPEDYARFIRYGEEWFRSETFGGERTTTDVAGLFQAELEVPCAPEDAGSPCRKKASALPFLVAALDRLDGKLGNLFQGNGGKLGEGYTNDLVIDFPAGTSIAGLPVPEHLHTGLDVDAGYPWPIGIVALPAPAADAALPYLVEPSALGAGPAAPGKLRLGIACALCHYSLDVDKDGHADMRSSRWGEDTPGSRWQARNAWGIGNQDVHFGWLFALTKNPLLGFTVLSGPVGKNTPADALSWVRWVKANYRRAPETVRREVVRGMLVQPRGLADDSPNALHDANQLPLLFTYRNWPYNFDGSFSDPADRNNGVWTGAIDFTGLIALASDRSGGQQKLLYWEPPGVYSALSSAEYVDMILDQAPAVQADPQSRATLAQDILGTSDGVPGLLRPDNVVLLKNGLGSIPPAVLNHPDNVTCQRLREAKDFGGDAARRDSMMVLLGTRVSTTARVRKELDVDGLVRRYPGLNADDFQSDVVSLFLDWLTPPTNSSELLSKARTVVPRGYEVFKAAGCPACHSGPFLTDNRMSRLYNRRSQEVGIAAPSVAAFRPLGRGSGPALDTAPFRSIANRALQLYVSPAYDPVSGKAVAQGGAVSGLFGSRPVGYKTLTLRYVWGSAPYLHDGGVAVALKPGAAPPGADLKALLSRSDDDKLYGMGSLLAYREEHQSSEPWPNAALSLQALLLRKERERVVRDNREPLIPVPIGAADNPLRVPARVSMVSLGVEGQGHDFYIDDVPGGERITALVAFLLALDDEPGALP